MTNDNEDALRCAARINCECDQCTSCRPHIFRLVRENEAKDALLRQAVETLEQSNRFVWHYAHNEATTRTAEACDAALAAIRQHLEGRA